MSMRVCAQVRAGGCETFVSFVCPSNCFFVRMCVLFASPSPPLSHEFRPCVRACRRVCVCMWLCVRVCARVCVCERSCVFPFRACFHFQYHYRSFRVFEKKNALRTDGRTNGRTDASRSSIFITYECQGKLREITSIILVMHQLLNQ